MDIQAPPLGLRPKKIWLEARLIEISNAIQRYHEANYEIPEQWYEEINTIKDWLTVYRH